MVSKARSSLDDDVLESDADFEYAVSETLQDKRIKNRRQTEIRRRMEDKLERRRLAEQLGMYLDQLELEDYDYITGSTISADSKADSAEEDRVDCGLIDDYYFDEPSYVREYSR